MAFGYSGAVDITRGVEKVWSDDTYYSFITTEECHISVDATPLVEVKAGEEFIIKVDAVYIFDRDTTLKLSYPLESGEESSNIWEKESLSHITENTNYRREYDTTVYHVGENRSGTVTITIGAHAWSQNTNSLDMNWYVTKRTSSGETRLIDDHDFDLPSNSGWNYMLHSVSSVSLSVSPDDVIALSFTAQQYVQIGSETSQEHGQFLRIEWD